VTAIPFSDFGVNLISSCIVVSRDKLAKDPDLARHFMKAATRAVQAAEIEPEAAVDAMLSAYPKAGERQLLIDGLRLTLRYTIPKKPEANRRSGSVRRTSQIR
jgi:NitT/TauT family transport system substrate-binding protein